MRIMNLQAYRDRHHFFPTDNLKFLPCTPSKSFFQHQPPSYKMLSNKLETKQFVFLPYCSWMTMCVGGTASAASFNCITDQTASACDANSVQTRDKPTRQENISASCNLCYLNDLLTLVIRFAWHDNIHNEVFSLELVGVCVLDHWNFHRRWKCKQQNPGLH
jgi:hypothetical protein